MKQPHIQKYLLPNRRIGIAVSDRNVTEAFPLHWHDYLELELVIGGRGYQVLNGQRIWLSAGCLSVIRLTDFHLVVPEKELQLLNLMIDDCILPREILDRLVSEHTMFYRLDRKESGILEQILRLCMEESGLPEPDLEYLKHLLSCVFLRILKSDKTESRAVSSENDPIQAVISYLHMHFRENPRLQEAASIAHYNPSHFSTTFHQKMGMPYCDYLNLIKISYAKELLLSTGLNIADICFECGFMSHSNFLRLFRKETGCSPMQFRKNAAAGSSAAENA